MKGNPKLMMVTAFAMISLLAMPILTLNLPVKAQQAQNQTSPLLSQVQKKARCSGKKENIIMFDYFRIILKVRTRNPIANIYI